MSDLSKFIIGEDFKVIEAMRKIDSNAEKIVFVCDGLRLKATISDGDIRRHILSGGDVQDSVANVANYHPIFLHISEAASAREVMRARGVNAIPVLDDNHEILRVEWSDAHHSRNREMLGIPVVIMAGGKGTRLHPYTSVLPKPLILVGEKTITEHIMDFFEAYGCTKFEMIVNYKMKLIEAFFSESEDQRDVSFTREPRFLGTGGGLKLIADKMKGTFFMTNCDILIDDDYSAILKYHKDSGNILTMVCAMVNYKVPYGTVDVTGERPVLVEKPEVTYMANTGFYVIEPEFLDYIPADTFVHITDAIDSCITAGEKVGFFPISENAWKDMGQFDELEKMRDALKEL